MTLSLELAPVQSRLIQGLLDAIDNAPIHEAPAYLAFGVGAMLCKVVAAGLAPYFHLVVSDQVTPACEQDIEDAFREEGVDRWRNCVVEILHMPHPNFHFKGSTQSTLYVIHPEVSR
ncbi:hypothetical protein AB0I84_07600 [Streptomyces spectabilis]|uniref:hypothetical protein n=1 Tax=Streptomyces spectabilis TaxID=68270 RepID=UPI0033D7486E